MSNYTILQRNTLLGLSETAGILYLKLLDAFQGHTDRSGERKAFMTACRYEDECGELIEYLVRNNPASPPQGPWVSELLEFFADRWRHNFMAPKGPRND